MARVAGWRTRPSPKPGTRSSAATVVSGRGVAISLRGGTYNAEIAEVEVNRRTGKIRVTRIVAGQDNGLTVNPRAVKLLMTRLDAARDDARVGTVVGGMTLITYLPTRIVELTIHTLDLIAALGQDAILTDGRMKEAGTTRRQG